MNLAMTISRGRTPPNPPSRHLPRGQGRGRPPKAHLVIRDVASQLSLRAVRSERQNVGRRF